jgi:hypothetical protein
MSEKYVVTLAMGSVTVVNLCVNKGKGYPITYREGTKGNNGKTLPIKT